MWHHLLVGSSAVVVQMDSVSGHSSRLPKRRVSVQITFGADILELASWLQPLSAQ